MNFIVVIWPNNVVTRFSAKDILFSAIWATVNKSSIHRVFKDRLKGPSDRTVRIYLLMFSIKLLLKKIHKLLMIPIKDILRSGRYKFAIDLIDIPYHGEPKNTLNEIRRSKAKSGTTHFHTYASLYVIRKNKQYTLDLLRVTKNTYTLRTPKYKCEVTFPLYVIKKYLNVDMEVLGQRHLSM